MLLSLPVKSQVNKIVPKNAFDSYTNSKQKKKFTDLLAKLTWINKLSFDTINLKGKDIKEIQVFQVELKKIEGFEELLQVIDKAIPYHIIFCVYFKDQVLFMASQKHFNPLNSDLAVIDWGFSSGWVQKTESVFKVNLERNLDFVFFDFCNQLVGKQQAVANLGALVAYDKNIKELSKSISALEASISKTKQFNKKVQLNIELQEKKTALQRIFSGS